MANLGAYFKNRETGAIIALGIVNKKKLQEKGIRLYHALGGGAKMTPEGKKFLQDNFAAEFAPEDDETSNDARFVIESEHADEVLKLFEICNPGFCELDPLRELQEELVLKANRGAPVLRFGSLNTASSDLIRVFRQESAQDGVGTSERSSQAMQTRRLFYIHLITVDSLTFMSLCCSSDIYCFDAQELKTTQNGKSKGINKDGLGMSDNLCNYVPEIFK